MSYRAAIFLLEGDRVALIERHRQGQHYFTFPGGHVDEGETPEQAAVREAREELGLEVETRPAGCQDELAREVAVLLPGGGHLRGFWNGER